MPLASQPDIFQPRPTVEQLSTASSGPGDRPYDPPLPPDGSYTELPPGDVPSKKRKRKVPTLRPDQWEPYKYRILELHVENGLPLKEVQRLIEVETGFSASTSMSAPSIFAATYPGQRLTDLLQSTSVQDTDQPMGTR